MLLAGDAIGHSQNGNNNAYCQDNEISWINWALKPAEQNLLSFAQFMIALRKNHPVFHRRNFFQGRAIKGAEIKDIQWLRPDGQEMTDDEWKQDSARCLGMFLAGDAFGEVDERAQPVKDETFLVLMNAHHEAVPFVLPALAQGEVWLTLVDTSCEPNGSPGCRREAGEAYSIEARSLAVLTVRAEGQIRAMERRRHGA